MVTKETIVADLILPPEKPIIQKPTIQSLQPAIALKPVKRKKHKRWIVLFLGLVIILLAAYLFIRPTYTNPLPKSVTKEVSFTLYYPKSIPGGYKYLTGSSNYKAGKIAYELKSGDLIIRVSEQALVLPAPNLNDLQNFSVFQASAGKAAIGSSGNVLNGILITSRTLIILNGIGGVSSQDLTQIINNMAP